MRVAMFIRKIANIIPTILFCYFVSKIYESQVYNFEFIALRIHLFTIYFKIDWISWSFIFLTSIMWIISAIYTEGYFDVKYAKINTDTNIGVIKVFMNLCCLLSVLIYISGNLFTIFIFYEILTICTIPLIYNKSIDSIKHYIQPLLYPSVVLFLGVVIYDIVQNNDHSSDVALFLFCMLIFGVSKAAIVPFHTWLPNAMQAPHPVSALLHSVVVVNVGIYVLLRASYDYFYNLTESDFTVFVLIIPLFSIVYSGIRAILSRNIKEMLAYSTINQLGICVLIICAFIKEGQLIIISLLAAHSFAKIALFFIAGNIFLILSKYKNHDLYGIYNELPITILLFVIFAFSLIGVPFTAGYCAKFLIKACLDTSQLKDLIVLWSINLGTLFSVVYLGKFMYIFCKNKKALPT